MALVVDRIEVWVWEAVVHIGALVERVGAHTHSTGPQTGTNQTAQTVRRILKTHRAEAARKLA